MEIAELIGGLFDKTKREPWQKWRRKSDLKIPPGLGYDAAFSDAAIEKIISVS